VKQRLLWGLLEVDSGCDAVCFFISFISFGLLVNMDLECINAFAKGGYDLVVALRHTDFAGMYLSDSLLCILSVFLPS